MMILPPQVNTAISMLYAAGYEAFLVGGAVRDYVRGNSPAKDWDITINALCRVTRLWACGFSEIVAKVQIDHMILSGPEYLDFGMLNSPILKIMPPKQYQTASRKTMPAWALRFMGQTEQGMQTMLSRIPDHISLESIRATWEAGFYLYRTDFSVQPDAKVACWYGEKEGHMKKAIQKLRKAYPKLTVRCFSDFGHGDIINHPELLVEEMIRFMNLLF